MRSSMQISWLPFGAAANREPRRRGLLFITHYNYPMGVSTGAGLQRGALGAGPGQRDCPYSGNRMYTTGLITYELNVEGTHSDGGKRAKNKQIPSVRN